MESFDALFDMAKNYCKQEISDTAYELWIECLNPLELDDNKAVLSVKTPFQRDIIKKKYSPLLKAAFLELMGFEVDVEIVSQDEKSVKKENTYQPEPDLTLPDNKYLEEMKRKNGEYEFTFETFIIGSSNKFAHAASLAVANNPSGSYNPLFIYGGSGLGKTHLLFAIYHEVVAKNKDIAVRYVRGEEFTNELIDAISKRDTASFHTKYRQVDVLLVDDIQFIAGKEQTQEEFFHTFNNLYQAGKQIVLTSDRPPKEIKTLEERLLTRFESGLLADVITPDFETRIAIIRRKAELLDFNIPNEVAEYVANRLKNNIRQLEGVVIKMKAYKLLAGSPPSIAVAQIAIRDILNDNQPAPVTVDRIINEVARTYGVDSEDIRSSKRSAPVSSARQISIHIVREITQMSTNAIGEEFGGRDHSTIVYALQQVEKSMQNDLKTKAAIEDIIRNIRDS